jgi:Astacin (Peptidase family M12A)
MDQEKRSKEESTMSDRSDQDRIDFGSEDWFRSSDEQRQGIVSANTFENKEITYSVIEGKAIFEGDILIGDVEDVEQDVAQTLAQIEGVETLSDLPTRGVVVVGERFRWPDCLVPFEINHPNRQLVLDAIRHWKERTPIRFVERNATNAGNFPNFLVFEMQDGCFSQVGMRGGRQVISLGISCGLGAAIHEIGHAVGLWHEQSREDRDQNVRIRFENIIPGREHNFLQRIADGDDVGVYDFGSIMHYPRTAFSRNGQPTIEPLGGQAIGQRTGLSHGDIAAIRAIYPACSD